MSLKWLYKIPIVLQNGLKKDLAQEFFLPENINFKTVQASISGCHE